MEMIWTSQQKIFNDNQKRMLTWNQVNKCVFIIHVYIYIMSI